MRRRDSGCGRISQGQGRTWRHGKARRGARVVYILRNESFPIFLIAAYAKNEKENLTKAERNELAKMADAIFNKYGR
jgi:hypothetical protein